MKNLLFLLIFAFLAVSCSEKHFLKDENYRSKVIAQFEKRKAEAAGRGEALFSVLDNERLTLEQKEALQFLYAYMPLCDLADYDGGFFLNQVDAAFRARNFFKWGKTVPDDIFRHFVLVYRINNEYLDTARTAFFDELKDRVKNLSMYDAALEVNHWCHEKVTYRGTDGRTSAPLALVKTSWGRCGEESTFTAAAMRAVGIPARQCYTPRWVHTDDNHAWVEVWIDGKWHYLGACEPEPELDAAWFTGPAKRAMMVHTNVFGLYEGAEEKNLEMPLYSIINLTANYAKTRKINVLITDENNSPVEGASVKFMVYNYAEFYPISTNTSGKDGKTSIVSGMGDIMLWANAGEKYGYAKSAPDDTLTVVCLNRSRGVAYEENIVMNVPPEQAVEALNPEKVKANAVRFAYEDSLRNAYMATFITREEAVKFAAANNLDSTETWKQLNRAQGNWQEIRDFISAEKENSNLFPFLKSLRDKDLRDTPSAYLISHIHPADNQEIKEGTPADFVVPYILSPRIESELITPWREYFRKQRDAATREEIRRNPKYLVDYVRDNIKINDDENYYNCRITPRGVFDLKIADRRSRNVFFVAACRSFGIPARVEWATGKPQYYENGKWIDVVFEPETASDANLPKGKITLQNATGNPTTPGYYSHYTLARFKDGAFKTLDYEGSWAVAKFPFTLELDEGYYRLMTGSRANDGSVFIDTRYFELKQGRPITMAVKMPDTENKLFVKGIVDMNTIVEIDNNKLTLKELSKGKGLLLCFLDLGKEPSKHILQDIPAVSRAFEAWGGGVMFAVPEGKMQKNIASEGLPKQSVWLNDKENKLLNSVADALKTDVKDNYPLVVYLNSNGGIIYSSIGYKIGIGEAVLKTISLE
ncbi:MAG: transglutaminase-like domain-containing protein [Dysgonamonadaceae bacterium]|jgi:transglutaminase-like putative cysteine protease|nr:transglutaminase-like domain-containing protein [Dysgonamonadaceae bacterium]